MRVYAHALREEETDPRSPLSAHASNELDDYERLTVALRVPACG